MIGKVVGYAGFQSYGELPFSTLKPGKAQQKEDKIWESTMRDQDKKPHLQNYHNIKSVYRKDYLENTLPQHYNVTIVQKGSKGFDKFSESNTVPTYEKLQSSSINNNVGKDPLLKTGVQHWRSNYQKENDEVRRCRNQLSRSLANGFGNSAAGRSGSKNFENNNKLDNYGDNKIENHGMNSGGMSAYGNNSLGALKGSLRSASASKPGTTNMFRPEVPLWSKNVKAYTNKAPTGVTQYKFTYGQRIGHMPKPHILDEDSTKQPRIFNPLKAGTTQLVEHIPGYQGFIPSSKTSGQAFEHGKGTMTRTTFLKSNLIDNYHVQIPGYSGFKTKQNFVSDDKLRSSCFRSNEFVKS